MICDQKLIVNLKSVPYVSRTYGRIELSAEYFPEFHDYRIELVQFIYNTV